jgi:hypothetical protein
MGVEVHHLREGAHNAAPDAGDELLTDAILVSDDALSSVVSANGGDLGVRELPIRMRTLVAGLLQPRRPPAISGLIVAVVVDPLDSQIVAIATG